MRVLFVILLLVGVSHGKLIGSLINLGNNIGQSVLNVGNNIGQTVSNLWNGVTGQVSNVVGNVVDKAGNIYGQMVNTINGVKFVSTFLWENTFNPALELFLDGGSQFLDDKFGNIVSQIGRRSTQSQNILAAKYAELVATFKTNIHQLYDQVFELEKQALQSLQKGQNKLEATIRAFHDKIASIYTQIGHMAEDLKTELEMHALTVEGEWVNIINEYSHNIDLNVTAMRSMFERLVHELMKNFLEIALKVVPEGAAIIENMKQQGLLSFIPQ